MNYLNKKVLGIHISAIVEIIILLSIICMCSYFFGKGNRFIYMTPHPFWIVLLLIIIQYDTPETLTCLVLMTIFLYFNNLPVKNQLATDYEYYYIISLRPAIWFVIAIILDVVRSRRIKRTDVFKQEVNLAQEKSDKISSSFKIVQKDNQELEAKLAGEVNTAVRIFRASRSLNDINSSNYLKKMERIITSIMSPIKFSIFMLKPEGAFMELEYNWNQTDKFKKYYSNSSSLYQEVIAKKHFLCIANENDEKTLDGHGMIAGPIIDIRTNQVFGLLKFEEAQFSSLITKNLKLFEIICEWIGFAYSNLTEMQNAKENTMTTHIDKVYSANFLKTQINFLTALSNRMGFESCKITIEIINFIQLSNKEKRLANYHLGLVVNKNMRTTDMVFEIATDGNSHVILLPGTKLEGAEIVLNKIKKILLSTDRKSLHNVKYSFILHSLTNNI